MNKDNSITGTPHQSSPFDSIRQIENDQEFWSARDLQTLLGYTNWQNFEKVIRKAMASCRNAGHNPENHWLTDINKPIISGKGRKQDVTDYRLTRYACYLIAMNGDSEKQEIALAQTYFTIKTREAETGMHDLATVANQLREDLAAQRLLLDEAQTAILDLGQLRTSNADLYTLSGLVGRWHEECDKLVALSKSLHTGITSTKLAQLNNIMNGFIEEIQQLETALTEEHANYRQTQRLLKEYRDVQHKLIDVLPVLSAPEAQLQITSGE